MQAVQCPSADEGIACTQGCRCVKCGVFNQEENKAASPETLDLLRNTTRMHGGSSSDVAKQAASPELVGSTARDHKRADCCRTRCHRVVTRPAESISELSSAVYSTTNADRRSRSIGADFKRIIDSSTSEEFVMPAALPPTNRQEIAAYLDARRAKIRRAHRRSRTSHRLAPRAPQRSNLRCRHRQDRRARPYSTERRRHEPPQGDQLREPRSATISRPMAGSIEGDAAHYDRARALFPADSRMGPGDAAEGMGSADQEPRRSAREAVLLDRVRKQLDDRGTLDVLRHGVEMIGLKQPLRWPSSSRRWP